MRILIDTNILIHLEDNKVIDEQFALFYQFAISNKCDIYYHPACLRDIKKDKDEERQKITLSKLSKYTKMPDPAIPSDEFTQQVGQKKDNDEIDNTQLFQVYKEYVDYFITEDSGIHTKASRINLGNKVLSITNGLKLLQEKYTLIIPQHPLLQECSIREIENELNNVFFDSLRESYNGFDAWFMKCARENRRCYILRVDGSIAAILIFHRERKADHDLPNVNDDALKMCTFKVAETAFGYRLGELFLSKMFDMCIKARIYHLYLTVFPQHTQLIDLLEKYGFTKYEFINKHGNEELRMIKSLIKGEYKDTPQAIKAHPFYTDGNGVNKFVIPIDPKFYETLFKDGSFRPPSLFDETEHGLNEIEGNTISKAYLCKSKRLTMKGGDLLLFYGSKNIGSIEPVGILDKVVYTKDINEIKNLVRRKTVYKDDDLEEMTKTNREITVLLFRLVCYLRKPIKFNSIKTLPSCSNNFQTITTLTEEDYNYLKQKHYFDERFIIH